jgi:hypothetical protein
MGDEDLSPLRHVSIQGRSGDEKSALYCRNGIGPGGHDADPAGRCRGDHGGMIARHRDPPVKDL